MVLPGTVEALACERDDWALSMNVLNATSLTTGGIVLMVGLFSEPLKDSCLSVLPVSLVAGALSGLTARLSGRECKRSEGRNSLLPSSRSNHGANRAGVLEREAGGYRGRMTESSAISGLHRLLGEARGRDLRLALISNAPKADAQDSLESLGLSEDIDAQKPDPAPYKEALEFLGLSAEEVVAFEDSPSGLSGAVRAGIPVVGICSTTHSPNELRRPARSSSSETSLTGPSTSGSSVEGRISRQLPHVAEMFSK